MWSLSEQGTLLDILEGVGAPVSLLARCGALVASASQQSSSFNVWDLTYAQKPQASAPFLDRTGLTAVSHQGSYIYFPKIGDKSKVTIWDLAEGLYGRSAVRCVGEPRSPGSAHSGGGNGVRPQKFISHGSGVWESKIKCRPAGDLVRGLFLVCRWRSSQCVPTRERAQGRRALLSPLLGALSLLWVPLW